MSGDPSPVRPSEFLAVIRRLDGVEAAIGELRAALELVAKGQADHWRVLLDRLSMLERAIGVDAEGPTS